MRKTVLVVGAGASCEAGFPSGEALVTAISATTRVIPQTRQEPESAGNPEFFELARRCFSRQWPSHTLSADVLRHMRELSAGVIHAHSIDNFLALHDDKSKLVFLGKLAIAYNISKFERQSGMYFSDPNIVAITKPMPIGTWYGRFFKALTAECTFQQLPDRLRDVCIICFNYDRNIEQYLLRAIARVYIVTEEEAAAALSNLTIWHPYGSLGDLPPMCAADGVVYGPEVGRDADVNLLIAITNSLRTFSEGSADLTAGAAQRVSGFFGAATRHVFLGFGFLPANMAILGTLKKASRYKPPQTPIVLATCFGAREYDREQYQGELSDLIGLNSPPSVKLGKRRTKCKKLFIEYSRALRFP